MLLAIPIIIFKSYLQEYFSHEQTNVAKPISEDNIINSIVNGSMINDPKKLAQLAIIGTVTGFATGLFGVGGGIVMYINKMIKKMY